MAKTKSGYIQRLPSGAFRVSVYAGTDPVTGKQRRLRETCPDEAASTAPVTAPFVTNSRRVNALFISQLTPSA